MSNHTPFDIAGFFPAIPFPVPAPTTDIRQSPSYSICFNEDWLPYIMGALKVLMRPETYSGTQSQIRDAVHNAMSIPDLLEDCVSGITWRQDGCHLYMTANGIETLVYNGQECIDANIADGTIAKANSGYIGVPAPGACHVYTVKLTISENWISPNVVNSGDTVLLSNWQGGATDLGMLATTWVCPSGTAYVLGACADTARAPTIYGTDPLQSAPHLAVIAQIGTTYYDVWNSASGITPATFTVPSGITNQPLRLLMNVGSAVGLVATGEMWGEVTICNLSRWCHRYDFTVSDQGWVPLVFQGLNLGVYENGQGWRSNYPETQWDDLQIYGPVFTESAITKVRLYFGANWTGVNPEVLIRQYPSETNIVTSTTQNTNMIELNVDTTLTRFIVVADRNIGGQQVWNTHLVAIEMEGSGTNPFGTSNCA